MDVQDLSRNHRIASLTRLMRDLEQSGTPAQTLRTLQRGFAEAYGFTASVLLATRGLPQGQYRLLQMRLEGERLDDVPDQARMESAPVQSGGVMGAIIERSEPQLIQEVDWSSDLFFRETLNGIYEPATRRFTYANAGRPRPLLRRSTQGTICPLDAVATFPLGIDASEIFKEATVQFEPGDTILLYTDGITEARNPKGDLFEQDRLTRLFADEGDRPAELIKHLRQAVRAYEQGQSPKDDQTLVAARAL